MRTLSICFSCLISIRKPTPCGTGKQVSLQYSKDNIKSRWKPKCKKTDWQIPNYLVGKQSKYFTKVWTELILNCLCYTHTIKTRREQRLKFMVEICFYLRLYNAVVVALLILASVCDKMLFFNQFYTNSFTCKISHDNQHALSLMTVHRSQL